ncbi:hypothetical protein CLF_106493 [Clonorchis sinensis]|uniref:Reverse transcriptase domain-containing protein n=1 Tax=Clonorchis sinensis TaxID=79923 RepID=H2KRJ3_CLOSI|nr:hypothetical protein CLF_106493 [Clonorchis sinensis]
MNKKEESGHHYRTPPIARKLLNSSPCTLTDSEVNHAEPGLCSFLEHDLVWAPSQYPSPCTAMNCTRTNKLIPHRPSSGAISRVVLLAAQSRGCSLSPLSVNFVTDVVMKRTLEDLKNPGVQTSPNDNLVDLEFVDDIVLIVEKRQQDAYRSLTILLFIGFESTSDYLDRFDLLSIVVKQSVPQSFVNIIRSLYSHTCECVGVYRKLSKSFPTVVAWFGKQRSLRQAVVRHAQYVPQSAEPSREILQLFQESHIGDHSFTGSLINMQHRVCAELVGSELFMAFSRKREKSAYLKDCMGEDSKTSKSDLNRALGPVQTTVGRRLFYASANRNRNTVV